MSSDKKITRVGANGKPYEGVLAEFVQEDKEKLLVDETKQEVLSEQEEKKIAGRKRRRKKTQ